VYTLIRKIAFLRDAESVHDSAMRFFSLAQQSAVGRALLRALAGPHAALPVQAMGLSFAHPLGVAAGFDKDARTVLALQELGFAYVEVGTVTPKPQPGNPKPRIWRFPEAQALVNALGFPGEGMARVHERLTVLRESSLLKIPVGINLGKNAATSAEDAVKDYLAVLDGLYELGDYFVVNVSSPNTVGLRDLQSVARLRPLLEPLAELNASRRAKPLLVKIAPDLNDLDVVAVGELARDLNLAGIVAGNTTIQRGIVPRAAAIDRGGLSGAPQFQRTAQLLSLLRPVLRSDQTLIAAGGIFSAANRAHCQRLGANLIQAYTAFIYLGPRCVGRLLGD
jgi:dihydroorotate dehydrogenase